MINIDPKTVSDRIKGLTAELHALEASHNTLIQENQKLNEQFREQVGKNQNRHAQLTGAIAELKELYQPKKNSEPTRRRDRVSPLETR